MLSIKFLMRWNETPKLKETDFQNVEQCNCSLIPMHLATKNAVSEPKMLNDVIKNESLEELDVKQKHTQIIPESDEGLCHFVQKVEFKEKFTNFSKYLPTQIEPVEDKIGIKKEIQDADSSGSVNSSFDSCEPNRLPIAADQRHNNCFVCIFCNKAHNYLSHLKKHMRIHSGEKPYTCEICCKYFRCKGTLKVHVLTHTGCKPFKCKVCEKEFQTSSNLKKHELIHTDIKPHTCDTCHRKYRCKTQMKSHRKQHLGEKKYCCSFCDEKFNYLVSLKTHLLKHTGEIPPFKCDVCDNSFRMSHHLKRHKESHVGAPFICQKCDKRFLQLRELQKHSSDCTNNFLDNLDHR